jgi:hypothetical protein
MLMFTLFNVKHVFLARNLLCSSMAAGLPHNYHIFIGLDRLAVQEMRSMNISALLLDVSDRNFEYYGFCKLKAHVQYRLLMWNVETTVCDDDIVFLKDPRALFREESDYEVSDEIRVFNFTSGDYRYDDFNVGFMRVLPSELSIQVYQKWLIAVVLVTGIIDQTIFHRVLGPYRDRSIRAQIQQYNMTGLLANDDPVPTRLLKIRWFDPLDVHIGGAMLDGRQRAREAALRRGVLEPYVVHFACIGPDGKRPFAEETGLWFLEKGEMKCKVPSKRFFDSWKTKSPVPW